MKIQISEKEADKIIQHKISALQKLKKPIKTDLKGKFIDVIFQRLEQIAEISEKDSDHWGNDYPKFTFSLSVYTNVDICLSASSISGFNKGIYEYEVDNKGKFWANGNVEQMNSLEDLKKYFSEYEKFLPHIIEIVSIDFIAMYCNTKTTFTYNK